MTHRLLSTVLMLGIVGLAVVPAQAATKIRITYSYANERIRPDPRPVNVTNSFDVTLEDGGKVSENINRASSARTDNFQAGMKLGSGWTVKGPNQLERRIDQPQSTLIVTATTSGSSCKGDIKWVLKPGFSEYKFKQIGGDQSFAFFTAPRVSSITCTIQ